MFENFEFYLQRKMKRLLLKPFTYWPAYQMGIIDENGNKLREPKTADERHRYNVFDELIRRMIKLFMKYTPSAKSLYRFKMFKEFLNDGFVKSLDESKQSHTKVDYYLITEEWCKEYYKRSVKNGSSNSN